MKRFLVLACATLATPVLPALAQVAAEDLPLAIVEPQRRNVRLAPVVEPPSVPPLPAGLLSFRVTTRDEAGTPPAELTVTRSATRMHVRAGDGRHEWWYERNPVDGRRASACLIDHQAKIILMLDDTTLRVERGIRGWADVIALGFDPAWLESMQATAERRVALDSEVRHYTATDAASRVREAWWSERLFLPVEFVISGLGGPRRTTIEELRGLDGSPDLAPPQERFPAYAQYDLHDWREHR